MLRKKNIYLPVMAFCFFGIALCFHINSELPDIKLSKQETALNLNRQFISYLSLGNQRLISNAIWIQTLMESDQEKYMKKDLSSWMYLRFLTISHLDPLFYENYLFGGMYLSVVKDDLNGASILFEKGLKYYPNDYRLNYYAGFNYFYELGDYEKGYKKLKVIADHPQAPPNLKLVINKLRFEVSNNFEIALEFLKNSYEMTTEPFIKSKLLADIYALTTERDLECLNNGRSDCRRKDLNGDLYFKDPSGKWKSQTDFLPYKIYRPSFKQ